MSGKIFLGPADTYAGGHPLLGEGKAYAFAPAILPGNIVTFDPGTGELAIGSYISGSEQYSPYVAIEQGSGLGATVNTPYAAGELVKFVKVRSGERVRVRAPAGLDISAGNPLTIGADGRVLGYVDGDHKFFVATGAYGETVANNGDLIVVEAV